VDALADEDLLGASHLLDLNANGGSALEDKVTTGPTPMRPLPFREMSGVRTRRYGARRATSLTPQASR
jgi:hypothetical protein